MHFDAEVTSCLLDHLTLGDLFRLRRALGREGASLVQQLPEFVHVARARMSLTKRTLKTPVDVLARLSTPALPHCRECGRNRCFRRFRVCLACGTDPNGYRSLMTRDQVLHIASLRPWRIAKRRLFMQLTPAAVSTNGAHLFWRSDVHRVLERG